MARVIIAVAPCPSEVSIGNVARKQLMVCLCELSLTPVSSASVHPLPAAEKRRRTAWRRTSAIPIRWSPQPERRAGELLAATPKNRGVKSQLKGKNSSGGPTVVPPEDIRPTLKQLEINKKHSSQWQRVSRPLVRPGALASDSPVRYTCGMVRLCWQYDGQDCAADFALESEARRCAEILRSRDNIRGVLLVDSDGQPLALEVSPAT
jgi:hypothetical protein